MPKPRAPSHPLGQADRRPRIHIWQAGDEVRWSFGPCGTRDKAASAGDAVDDALRSIQHRPAVIIFEGAEHG
jgi:hypothetical protein